MTTWISARVKEFRKYAKVYITEVPQKVLENAQKQLS